MSKNIEQRYKDFVTNNFIVYDEKQIEVLKSIDKEWQQRKRINFFLQLKKYQGIYVHGSVGIGKTFILNLFLQSIAESIKYHFNHLMINLHAYINNAENTINSTYNYLTIIYKYLQKIKEELDSLDKSNILYSKLLGILKII